MIKSRVANNDSKLIALYIIWHSCVEEGMSFCAGNTYKLGVLPVRLVSICI